MNSLSVNSENLYEKISYQLLLNGFSVINDFSKTDEDLFLSLKNLHYSENIDLADTSYPGGFCRIYENVTESAVKFIPKSISLFIKNKIINDIATQYLNTFKFKIDVFQTLDTINSNHIAQDPHFDRIPTLKFMLYINDMDENNGAFCLSPGSHHWVREKFPLPRPKHSDIKYLEDSRKLPSSATQNLIKINGKAGQLLIFHTDCIHQQGIVTQGESRIFRAHFRDPEKYTTKDQSTFSYRKSQLKYKLKSLKNALHNSNLN